MFTWSCSTSFLTFCRPVAGLLASSSTMTWMSRPPALFPTSPRYILKPFSMALPSWAKVPVVETGSPILIGPPAAALPAGLAEAAPEAAGLADALAAGLAAALDAGAADGAAPPPQAARASVAAPTMGARNFNVTWASLLFVALTFVPQARLALQAVLGVPRADIGVGYFPHAPSHGSHAPHRRSHFRRDHPLRQPGRQGRL